MSCVKNLISLRRPNTLPLALHKSVHSSEEIAQLVQNRSLKDSLFLGIREDTPMQIPLPNCFVVQTANPSFEFLAHLSSQVRLKGKRVVWVSPQRNRFDFELLNVACRPKLQLRDYQFCTPFDEFKLAHPDSLVFCKNDNIRHPKMDASMAVLSAHFAINTHIHYSAEAHSEQATKPLADTFFIFENLPLSSFRNKDCNFLQELKNLGASWVVTTSGHISEDCAALAAADNTLELNSFVAAQLNLSSCEAHQDIERRLRNSKSYPQSVWQPHSHQPLVWISQGLERQTELINALAHRSAALDQVFNPNLNIQPEFWLGSGLQPWYYNAQGERVLLDRPQPRNPLDTSPYALFNLMLCIFDSSKDFEPNATAADPHTRQRIKFKFEAKVGSLSHTTGLFSFDRLCEIMSNVLAEHQVVLGASQVSQDSEPTPLVTSKPLAFHELPARLQTLFWLQAYQLARPAETGSTGQSERALPYSQYCGVLGLPVPEELDLLAQLSVEEHRVWEILMRQARHAGYSFFFSDSTGYAAAIEQYEKGTAPENSFIQLIQYYTGAVYAENPAQLNG